jgi:hypothetical protein
LALQGASSRNTGFSMEPPHISCTLVLVLFAGVLDNPT